MCDIVTPKENKVRSLPVDIPTSYNPVVLRIFEYRRWPTLIAA